MGTVAVNDLEFAMYADLTGIAVAGRWSDGRDLSRRDLSALIRFLWKWRVGLL